MVPFTASAILVGVACLATGSLPPHLVDQCDAQDNPRDSAPIVLVGVLESDTLVARPIPQRSNPKYPLQLRQIRVRVENLLKGDVGSGAVAIYYFTFAGGFDGPQPLGMWRVGSRRVLWLRKDSGVLRTACDGWDHCTWGVYSGPHPHYTFDPKKPVAFAVADILLTRGAGKINENRFAASIDRGVPGPEDYLIEKYRSLASTESPPIKTAACSLLWIDAQDQGIPTFTRRSAAEAMIEGDCKCSTNSRGGPNCGPVAHSDPPW